MRVLVVTRSIPQHAGSGGMERITWDVAQGLAKSANVTILTTPVPGFPRTWHSGPIRVVTLDGTRSGRYSPAWWLRTARLRVRDRFDLVLSASAGATAMIHLRPGPVYVIHAHGTALRELGNALRVRPGKWPLKVLRYLFWIALDTLTYRRAQAVIAASEQVVRGLGSWPYTLAWRKTPLETTPNAIDADHFRFDPRLRSEYRQVLGIPIDAVVVASISRLDRQKGVDRAINALSEAKRPVHLLVGGSGPEEESLRRLALSSQATGRVWFLGQLDYEAISSVLAAADVFVLPVRNFEREALPLSVLEALAAGLPVIVPSGSEWPDDIAERLDFVDVASPSALAAAIDAKASTGDRENRLPLDYAIAQWRPAALDFANR